MTMYQKSLIITVLTMTCLSLSAQKFVGGDISLLTQYEEHKAKYYDNSGKAISSLLPFFKEQGMNAMRVRLFVDPANASTTEKGEGVCQDLAYVKALGKRIKDAGFRLMLDFHYSDTWADPAKQWTPKAWISLSDEELQEKIYNYTKEVLEEMKANGAEPDFIQTGNEISYGMCWGDVNVKTHYTYAGNGDSHWSRFTSLLKQAGKACREVCPLAKIIIHTERVARPDYLATYYQEINKAGIDYDIIGLSYYSYYHGNLNTLEAALKRIESNFADKDIMLVEVGYYHKWQPSTITGSYDLSATYPITEAGQKAYTDALVTQLNKHEKVKGFFWWWMEANEYGLDWNTKRVTDGWYNAGLFDNETGKALSALSSLKDFLNGDSGIRPLEDGTVSQTDDSLYDLGGRKVVNAPSSNGRLKPGIYVSKKRKIAIR